MKEVKNILVVYIATGDYNSMYHGFLDSLDKFCPGHNVRVAYVGDRNDHNKVKHIEHEPWPIVALMKFKHILDSIDIMKSIIFDPDYVVYFNSNIKFVKNVSFEEFFDEKKLTAVEHCTWEVNNHDPSKLLFGGFVKPETSKAFIPSNDYTYIQTSVFGGPLDIMKRMCITCHAWTTQDLAHNIIPTWHDESYGNKWVYSNPNSVRILSNKYNASEADLSEWGPDDPSIVMRDSSKTQWSYKERYHVTCDTCLDYDKCGGDNVNCDGFIPK